MFDLPEGLLWTSFVWWTQLFVTSKREVRCNIGDRTIAVRADQLRHSSSSTVRVACLFLATC
eukprot:COSAG01_NODE_5984_length_3919_cov_1.909686_6_plen_62_part_00